MNHDQLRTTAATTAHAAIRTLQALAEEPDPSPEWDHLPTWQRDGLYAAVDATLNGSSPADLHAAWVADRRARGWTHGPVKDTHTKTHPCLVDDWHALPFNQRLKDILLSNITLAVFGNPTSRTH